MIKVLVVDDEPIAAQSVVYMLEKNFNQIEIVGTSRSGKDAIEKSYNLHPDIIIMDINMPGINGLDAMRQIRSTNINVCFVVLSAFDYFDYAIEAVKIGVQEYLLKPVNEKKLVDAITTVIKTIEIKREEIRRDLEQRERLEMTTPMLESGFINTLCRGNSNKRELNNYCELFGYSNVSGYVFVIEIRKKDESCGENEHMESIYEELRKIIKSTVNSIVGIDILSRLVVYVFENNSDSVEKMIESCKKILTRAERISDKISVGIGRYYEELILASKSYEEAIEALNILYTKNNNTGINEKILQIDNIVEVENKCCDEDINKLQNELINHLSDDNKDEMLSIFDEYFLKISGDSCTSINDTKNKIITIMMEIDKKYINVFGDYCEVLSKIINSSDYKQLNVISREYLVIAFNKIVSPKATKNNAIIERADKYIADNLDKDISLEDVANEVNLSSYYFSRYYKEGTGINFSDKLMSTRMDKAQELLKQEELSIKDVSYMVGYAEPNYFSKVFKKYFGITATDYKNSILTE